MNEVSATGTRTAKEHKPSQESRLESLFRSRPDTWIPVYEIQKIAGFQYGARLYALRHDKGMDIPEPREERINGESHTWYMFRTVVIDNHGQESFAAINTHSTVGKAVSKKENAYAEVA